ncbi:MAG: type I glyceraldehyde-3-phosphate dehydrogenase [Proteobacteria bacterium]|nr:type I glyceraldehyde-3-phosphate dehydrogenase [Pseudomonadota bacterium]
MKKVAINGLGRIGRLVLRQYLMGNYQDLEIIAVNDLTPADDIAYLMRYDSVHGKPPFAVEAAEDYLSFDSKKIKLFSKKDPAELPWKSLGVDIVLECTGIFRKREDAAKHLEAGAKRVIISAPSKSADLTVVMGVNEDQYDPEKHQVISNASCTTNSLAPVLKILNDAFEIESVLITTIHAYTASQAMVDGPARKRRRGRAAAVSLIPTSTGSAIATALVLPELEGKMDAIAVRAPIPDGAITDIVAYVRKEVSVESVNAEFKKAAHGKLQGILDYTEDEIVSADIIGDPHSGIVDGSFTRVVNSKLIKALVWYDNEFGYSVRMLDLAAYMAKK